MICFIINLIARSFKKLLIYVIVDVKDICYTNVNTFYLND